MISTGIGKFLLVLMILLNDESKKISKYSN